MDDYPKRWQMPDDPLLSIPPMIDVDEDTLNSGGEIRTVSSTGAEKGVKLARFDLLPPNALWQIAEHFGRGARKYTRPGECNCPAGAPSKTDAEHSPGCRALTIVSGDRNWEAGYEWGKSYQALQRHLNAFWAGEDIDEQTGSPHLAAAGFHVLVLLEYMDTHPEFDDRPRRMKQ